VTLVDDLLDLNKKKWEPYLACFVSEGVAKKHFLRLLVAFAQLAVILWRQVYPLKLLNRNKLRECFKC
jgi:hypothetical protein